jgi:methionyl-tRNA formyltransferase|tara:strand:+ start:85 stop:666 length:582 start_codon:yes stop_codon:yes gene_type:complete
MKSKKICLLLGKLEDTFKLKKAISKKNWRVISKNKKLTLKDIKNIDLVITFNYRFIIKENVLKKLKRPPVNLHISYLPYNKGCHPNFWSFVENTPKGVTIHEIDKGVDTGAIAYQKKFFFNINKKENDNFYKTNNILLFEIQKLFLNKIDQILKKKYTLKKQKKRGSFHYRGDLPQFMKKNWKSNIKDTLKNL